MAGFCTMSDADPPSMDSSTQVDYVVLAPGRRVGRSLNDASATGKVSVNALTLDIRGINMSARRSLPRRAD